MAGVTKRGGWRAQTALVVGAGQQPGETVGNGRAIALRFAEEGAKVMCVDRHLARAQETADMVAGAGGDAFAHEADVSSPDAVKAAIAAAVKRLERIEILVHNVGIKAGAAMVRSTSPPKPHGTGSWA